LFRGESVFDQAVPTVVVEEHVLRLEIPCKHNADSGQTTAAMHAAGYVPPSFKG
jgi:hypothetical protein